MGQGANPRYFSFLFVLVLTPLLASGGVVMTGTFGANSRDHFIGAKLAYNAAFYAKLDDQTLLGLQSGQGTVSSSRAIPIYASAIIRLPLGRIVLPIATGDLGYALDSQHAGFIWRAGGGFDIRNGRHSSLLLLGAYEKQGSAVGWAGRLGVLLEF
jgi:hypothetical protein